MSSCWYNALALTTSVHTFILIFYVAIQMYMVSSPLVVFRFYSILQHFSLKTQTRALRHSIPSHTTYFQYPRNVFRCFPDDVSLYLLLFVSFACVYLEFILNVFHYYRNCRGYFSIYSAKKICVHTRTSRAASTQCKIVYFSRVLKNRSPWRHEGFIGVNFLTILAFVHAFKSYTLKICLIFFPFHTCSWDLT